MVSRACVGMVLLCVVGCGPSGSDDVPGGDDIADGPDAGPPCETVCFRWLPEEPPPPEPVPGEPVAIEYGECNPYGLRPGVCPEGFDCGDDETFETATLSVTTPVCSPGGAAPHVVDVGLAPAPLAADAIDVSLALALNGGAWPDGSADLPRAGTFRVISQRDPELSWIFDIPSDQQTLELSLPVDTYDVEVNIEDYQGRHYPPQFRRGELEVIDAGAHVVPFQAAIASFAVRLDGAPVGPLAAGHGATVQLTRVEGGFTWRSFAAGETPAGTIVLVPGDYR